MVLDQAYDPSSQTWWNHPSCGSARGSQRADVHFEHRLPKASAARGSAASFDPEASPSGANIDSQSVDNSEKGAWIDQSGYGAGMNFKDKMRHILIDTQGLMMRANVHRADIQDRDGALVLATLFSLFPFLPKLFAVGGNQGEQFGTAKVKTPPNLKTQIVKPSGTASGFEVLPRRWLVKRTFAWLGRCGPLAKDWENLNRNAHAFLRIASIQLMPRELCNPSS